MPVRSEDATRLHWYVNDTTGVRFLCGSVRGERVALYARERLGAVTILTKDDLSSGYSVAQPTSDEEEFARDMIAGWASPPAASRRPGRPRPVHMAKLLGNGGRVSPWCARRPRALDLTQSSWTNRREAVTCARCLAEMTRG